MEVLGIKKLNIKWISNILVVMILAGVNCSAIYKVSDCKTKTPCKTKIIPDNRNAGRSYFKNKNSSVPMVMNNSISFSDDDFSDDDFFDLLDADCLKDAAWDLGIEIGNFEKTKFFEIQKKKIETNPVKKREKFVVENPKHVLFYKFINSWKTFNSVLENICTLDNRFEILKFEPEPESMKIAFETILSNYERCKQKNMVDKLLKNIITRVYNVLSLVGKIDFEYFKKCNLYNHKDIFDNYLFEKSPEYKLALSNEKLCLLLEYLIDDLDNVAFSMFKICSSFN